eukprot:4468984-Lingulodinium_polyedra.AAC.1
MSLGPGAHRVANLHRFLRAALAPQLAGQELPPWLRAHNQTLAGFPLNLPACTAPLVDRGNGP